MYMRISSALILFLLAACGSAANQNSGADHGDEVAADNGRIDCAPDGVADFRPLCTLDRVVDRDGLTLVVHNPDGGFHRLLVTGDGRGVVAADGAGKAKVTIIGSDEIEVAVGGDRYRLPATIEGRSTR